MAETTTAAASERRARESIARLEGFLQQDPDNTFLIADLARQYRNIGKFDRAAHILQDAIARHEDDNALKVELASVSMASGQPEEAVDLLQGLMDRGVKDPVVRYNLAYALMYCGRYEAARDILLGLNQSADAPPDSALLLARAQHQLGDLSAGITAAQDFLARKQDDTEGCGVLALLYLDAGERERAEELANHVLTGDPNSHEARLVLGSLALERKQAAKAREMFTTTLEGHTDSGRAWAGLGLTAMLEGDLSEAIANLKKSVAIMPAHLGTRIALVWAQIVAGDLNAAEHESREALAVDRNFGESHGTLAVIAAMRGREEEARKEIDRALGLDHNSYSARFARALLLDQAGSKQDAQRLIVSMLAGRLKPEGPRLLDLLKTDGEKGK